MGHGCPPGPGTRASQKGPNGWHSLSHGGRGLAGDPVYTADSGEEYLFQCTQRRRWIQTLLVNKNKVTNLCNSSVSQKLPQNKVLKNTTLGVSYAWFRDEGLKRRGPRTQLPWALALGMGVAGRVLPPAFLRENVLLTAHPSGPRGVPALADAPRKPLTVSSPRACASRPVCSRPARSSCR